VYVEGVGEACSTISVSSVFEVSDWSAEASGEDGGESAEQRSMRVTGRIGSPKLLFVVGGAQGSETLRFQLLAPNRPQPRSAERSLCEGQMV
jgi:hypothetical protein